MTGQQTGKGPGFTPGPWQATRSDDFLNTHFWWVTAAPDGNNSEKEIARTSSGFPHDVHAANARLIAAAPDLYEALEAMLRAYGNEAEEVAAHRQAEVAIRKARGEQ